MKQQRKAKRLEFDHQHRLPASPRQQRCKTAQDERHQLHIQYRLIADRFTVAKLVARERIASLELAA
jgi:hypothetical protein